MKGGGAKNRPNYDVATNLWRSLNKRAKTGDNLKALQTRMKRDNKHTNYTKDDYKDLTGQHQKDKSRAETAEETQPRTTSCK